MAVSLTAALRNDFADAVLAALDVAAAALLRIYDGTPPASVDAALAGNNVVCEYTLPDPAGSVSGHTLTLDFDPDIEANAASSTTITFWRLLDSTAAAVAQGTCGTSGADLIVTEVTVLSGQIVRVTALSIAFPNP